MSNKAKQPGLPQTVQNQDSSMESNVKYLPLPEAESYVSLDLKPDETRKSSNCFNQCLEKWRKLDSKALTIVLILILLIIELTVGVIIPSKGSFSASLSPGAKKNPFTYGAKLISHRLEEEELR